MSGNNVNPRRYVYFSQTPPSNKSDLWLSYNLHYEYDDNDELVEQSDISTHRHCDLVLKFYDCGEWKPVFGVDSDELNKIDTVTGITYTDHNGDHTGKTKYHPAIYTDATPNELYDAGSLGEILNDSHFVTETDWQNIYNDHLETIFESVENPFQLGLASTTDIGGIKSDVFSVSQMENPQLAFKPVECKFLNNTNTSLQNYGRLFVDGAEIVHSMFEDPYDIPLQPGTGINFDYATGDVGSITISLDMTGAASGKVLTATSSGSVEWMDGGQTYPVLSQDNHSSGTYYVVEGGGNDKQFLNGFGYWITIDNQGYTGSRFIEISGSNNAICVKEPSEITDSQRIYCLSYDRNGGNQKLDWRPFSNTSYNGGIGINISGNYINIDTGLASSGQVLTCNATGGVEWQTISTGYTAGDGIDISTGNVISLVAPSGSGSVESGLVYGGVKARSITEVIDPTLADKRLEVFRNGDTSAKLCVNRRDVINTIPDIVEYDIDASGGVKFYAASGHTGQGEYTLSKNTYYVPSGNVTGAIQYVYIDGNVDLDGESTIFMKYSTDDSSAVYFDYSMSFVPTVTVSSSGVVSTGSYAYVEMNDALGKNGIAQILIKKDSIRIDETCKYQ